MEAHVARSVGARVEMRPDGKAREILGIDREVLDIFSSRSKVIAPRVQELLEAFEARFGRPASPYERAVIAQQVFGGHGYIEEHGMSQYVRDARIAMIYEGANGIQALDLVGRKLGMNGGRAVMALFKEIGDFCEENRADESLSFFTKHLKKGLNDLQAATMWFMQHALAKPDNAGAGSTDYMHLFGLVIVGYMWAKMAKAAQAGLAAGASEREAFLRNKLITARFFMERIMPETALRKARIEAGAETMMAMAAEAF